MECKKVTMDSSCSNGLIENGYESHFEEIQIPVPWGHIAGKWWGSLDRQPIIALHGWQDNAGTFDRLAPLLVKAGHSVFCIDLPGHGFSSHYPKSTFYYVFWDGLVTLRRITKYYNWSNVTLMGHSLGGAVSFLYAASYPDEVDRYISIDIVSPAVRNSKTMVPLIGSSIDKFLKYENLTSDLTPCYDYEQMINIVEAAHNGSCTRSSCEILMRRGMLPVPSHLNKDGYVFSRDPRLKVSTLGFMEINAALEFASKVKCKVLNIRATNQRKDIHTEYYDMVLKKISEQARVACHEVEGTHHLHLNDGNSVFPIINDFLSN